jgi:hypothetical protein
MSFLTSALSHVAVTSILLGALVKAKAIEYVLFAMTAKHFACYASVVGTAYGWQSSVVQLATALDPPAMPHHAATLQHPPSRHRSAGTYDALRNKARLFVHLLEPRYIRHITRCNDGAPEALPRARDCVQGARGAPRKQCITDWIRVRGALEAPASRAPWEPRGTAQERHSYLCR